jgi:predicted enzyme related to lactoylglutathione lyase
LDDEMSTTWSCLCLDVNGPEAGEFWAKALGATLRRGDDPRDPGALIGPDGLLMELEPVPEPKVTKNRVHLDLHLGSIAQVTDLGAKVTIPQEASGFAWTVLEDPAGNDFCVFVRDEPPEFPLHDVIVDSAHPEAIAGWWAERFGVRAGHDPDHQVWGIDQVPGMPFENVVFVPVPEPKTVKNRMHWDVRGDVAELERAGAKVLAERSRWVVMADPEGNEFCVFPPD